MKSLGIVLVAVLFALGSFTPALADTQAPKAAASFDSAALNLTSDQSEKIQTLRENRWNELKPLRTRLFAKLEELKSMLTRNKRDESRIQVMQSEILSIQSKIHDRLTAYRLELKKILTPDQQSKLTAYGLERGYFRNGIKHAGYDGNSSGDARRQ